MKSVIGFLLIFLFAGSLLGCTPGKAVEDEKQQPPSGEPGIVGYVMQKENERILVISQESRDFSANGGVKEYYDAIWFSNVPKDIKVGEKVKVWYDFVRESYPGQSEVKDIEVVSSEKPKGAKLTEAEVLLMALTSQEVKVSDLLVVKEIEYDSQAARWNVELKEIWSDKIVRIQISDK
jgi:hypothetical protein